MAAKTFWLSRSKTDGGPVSRYYVNISRKRPVRVVKIEAVKDWYGNPLGLQKRDYFKCGSVETMCPSGVLRVTGLRFPSGKSTSMKVKLVRVK